MTRAIPKHVEIGKDWFMTDDLIHFMTCLDRVTGKNTSEHKQKMTAEDLETVAELNYLSD